eukprot:XP_001706853.1 Hypothetical protein GL50803_39580 [Giardia lamblia ATCC 50803]
MGQGVLRFLGFKALPNVWPGVMLWLHTAPLSTYQQLL